MLFSDTGRRDRAELLSASEKDWAFEKETGQKGGGGQQWGLAELGEGNTTRSRTGLVHMKPSGVANWHLSQRLEDRALPSCVTWNEQEILCSLELSEAAL